MSTIDEIVYKRLRDGNDPRTVRKSVSSMSQYARGVQRFIEWSHSEVARLRNQVTATFTELGGLEQQVREFQGDRDNLDEAIKTLQRDEIRLTRRNQRTSTRLATVREEVSALEARSTALQTGIRELVERGYTDEIVSQISSADAASGDELLRRLVTLTKYDSQIQDAQNTLRTLNRDTEERRDELTRLTADLGDTEKKRLAAEGQHRRLRDARRHLRAAIKVVEALMREYRLTNRDFEHLWRLIGEYGTEAMPGQTMDAVVRVVETYRTLTELEAAVEGGRQALAAVDAQLRTQEQRLEVSRLAFTRLRRQYDGLGRAFQRTIRALGDEFEQTLTHLRDAASRNLTSVADDSRTAIVNAKDTAVESINEVRTNGEETLVQLVKQCSEILKEIEASRKLEREEQNKRRAEWGQLQAEAGQLASEIKSANVFLGLKMDPEALSLIGKDDVLLLLRRITEWSELQDWDYRKEPKVSLRRLYTLTPNGEDEFSFEDALNECIVALNRGKLSE